VQNFVDAELNGLLDAIASEANATKRLELVGDVQAYIVDQAYTIPLLEEPQVFAGSPHVQGVAFESVGRPNFYSTWLDK
jgi:peptide/nickel transport system substrate-binding protein